VADVVLHQWDISPFCRKVRKVLRLKGIAYVTVDYNGIRAPRAARLTASGKLPVLDWDGQRIADSSLICEFLDRQVQAPPLYPADRRDAALARLLEDWADESLYYFEMHFRAAYPEASAKAIELLCVGRPRWEQRIVGPLFRRALRGRLKAHGFGGAGNDAIERSFFAHIDDLAAWLEGRRWLVGDAQSIADLSVAAQLEEIVSTNPLAARLLERPAVSAWLARTAKD
jgi:glutathione S-transferase